MTRRTAFLVAAAIITFQLSLLGGVIWIVVHFVRKYW